MASSSSSGFHAAWLEEHPDDVLVTVRAAKMRLVQLVRARGSLSGEKGAGRPPCFLAALARMSGVTLSLLAPSGVRAQERGTALCPF